MFFRSEEPESLAAWYRRHLGIELAPDFVGSPFVAKDGDVTVWSIFPAETTYFERPLMINYRVRDLDAMLAQLRAAGVDTDEVVEDATGRFSWGTDPEGNRFELWEPPSA